MAFDQRDYMKESHVRNNEKNLGIYNPKEFRRDTEHQQYQTGPYDELPKFKPYTQEEKFALFLILGSICWIVFAIWKFLHT